jgi:hypothetical protein
MERYHPGSTVPTQPPKMNGALSGRISSNPTFNDIFEGDLSEASD